MEGRIDAVENKVAQIEETVSSMKEQIEERISAVEQQNPEGQIARWIQRLQEYDITIRYRKGSSHENADALSRRSCPENCRYCSSVETQYQLLNPLARQITTSTSADPDPWSEKKVRKDQLEDRDIKPIIGLI
ncbi:hypothetical protein X975_03269, partial [Stegodyphus mimosarum]